MTTQDYTDHAGSDFADTDVRFAALLAGLDWLGDEGAHLARTGLRELRRTIRTHTFAGRPVDIHISATATAGCLTVILEDSGPEVAGDRRLHILDQAYDQVSYGHTLGRNRWILRRFARRATSAVRLSVAA